MQNLDTSDATTILPHQFIPVQLFPSGFEWMFQPKVFLMTISIENKPSSTTLSRFEKKGHEIQGNWLIQDRKL
jgi:hypothetical protein